MSGFGDDLLCAGIAESLYTFQPTRGPVYICDQYGTARWSSIWQGNPAIRPPDGGSAHKRAVGIDDRYVRCGKGCLPYLQYPLGPNNQWRWHSHYRAQDFRGHLYLTEEELEVGRCAASWGPYILIEPSPVRGNKNRRWPTAQWQMVADEVRIGGRRVVQLNHSTARLLERLDAYVEHRSFREAVAIVQHASLLVTTEGGLAHAAAALGTPAVVLWGGCISAPVLSYPEHVNLVDPSPETPCGTRAPCPHCSRAWSKLTPDQVTDAVLTAWRRIHNAPIARSVL